MNIYAPKDTDDIVISLKEYFKNNPFDIKDHRPDDWIAIPAWNKGLKSSPETISKLSISQKNRLKNGQPESQKLAAKKAMTENSKRTMVCDKCGKINNLGNHKRWHGDNCGIKTTRSEEIKQKISKSMSDHIKSAGRSEKQKLAWLESNKKRKGKKYPNGYKTKNKISNVS